MMMNAGPVPMFSQVIESRRDFDRLIRGYERLRAISYVVSLDLLLQLFQTYGFEQVEVLVGENLSGSSLADRYRESLSQKGEQVTCELAELVTNGRLRILVPRRCIHSKLYILGGAGAYRVIQGSLNLTETARQAWTQVNYVWWADLAEGVGADGQLRRSKGTGGDGDDTQDKQPRAHQPLCSGGGGHWRSRFLCAQSGTTRRAARFLHRTLSCAGSQSGCLLDVHSPVGGERHTVGSAGLLHGN